MRNALALRIAVGALLVGISWGSALYLHRREVTVHVAAVGHPTAVCAGSCYATGADVLGYTGGTPARSYTRHPAWEDPLALGLAVVAAGLGAALVALRSTG